MNSLDWESKFNAIVRDTVHNLDTVKERLDSTKNESFAVASGSVCDDECMTETDLGLSALTHTYDIPSYFDVGGFQPDSLWKPYHFPRGGGGALTDVVSSGIPTAATEVRHHPVETSSSIIILLHDKIDSQSKVIEELMMRLQKSDEARENHLREMQSLKDEMSRLRDRVAERGVDLATEQKFAVLQQQWTGEMQSLQSQLFSLHSRVDEITSKNSTTSTSLLELQRFTNSEVDYIRRELQSLKTKLERVETDVANFTSHHQASTQQCKNEVSQTSRDAWQSIQSSNAAALNRGGSAVSFQTPYLTNVANDTDLPTTLLPSTDVAQLRYQDLQKKLAELESQFLANPQFYSSGRKSRRRKPRSVNRPSLESYDLTSYNASDVDTDTPVICVPPQAAQRTAISSSDPVHTTDALSDLSTDDDDNYYSSSTDNL